MSFGIIRGGHVDYTALGVLEVDQEGNLANYKIPGKLCRNGRSHGSGRRLAHRHRRDNLP